MFKEHLHSTIKSKDTEVLGGLRARPNEIKARSSRLSWKNCSLWLCNVHCWNATQNYSTETVLLIFPLSPDQHHCSDVAKWRLWRYRNVYIIIISITDTYPCSSRRRCHQVQIRRLWDLCHARVCMLHASTVGPHTDISGYMLPPHLLT